MAVTVRRVGNKQDLDAFLHVPYHLYGDDPHYVFPLLSEQKKFFDPDHNPFHRHAETALWTAWRGDHPVGRIAACIDSYHNDHHQEKTGFFGFFETEDDPAQAELLLAEAKAWLTDHGADTMRGPASFTTNHDYLGLLVDGFDEDPAIGMPYNPPYYADHLENFGLSKVKDLWAWNVITDGKNVPPKIQKLIDGILQSATFTVRPFRMKQFWDDAKIARALYNECWSKNWGFVPMDDDEFAFIAKDMKSMVDADYLLIAEHEGRPIGFSLTIPDFNQALKPLRGKLLPFGWLKFMVGKRKLHSGRTLLLGVLPEYRKRGVDIVMVYRTMIAGQAKGYDRAECSWVLEDNRAMNMILRGYGAEKNKTYRIYELPLR